MCTRCGRKSPFRPALLTLDKAAISRAQRMAGMVNLHRCVRPVSERRDWAESGQNSLAATKEGLPFFVAYPQYLVALVFSDRVVNPWTSFCFAGFGYNFFVL